MDTLCPKTYSQSVGQDSGITLKIMQYPTSMLHELNLCCFKIISHLYM